MSIFLDTLKERLMEAQKRLQSVTAKFQAAQSEQAVVNQEVFGWAKAVEAESKRESLEASLASLSVVHGAAREPKPEPKLEPPPPAVIVDEVNKTELIREVIRQHPAGVTPVDIWHSVKDQIPRRAYVYSVLGRLKDREQVTVRRGKYFFRVTTKPNEVKAEEATLSIQ